MIRLLETRYLLWLDQIAGWGRRPFQAAIWLVFQFILLTTLAMWIFPGGTMADPATQGYSFWNNFFSELGMTVTESGAANPIGAVLFFIALSGAGLAELVFFLAFLQFFSGSRLLRALSLAGTFFGIISGLGFIGVAFTPANLLLAAHAEFVLLAFRAFVPAVFFYCLAIWLHPHFPNVYAGIYLAFAALLVAYIWLLTSGPELASAQGVLVQAVGQKVIVYAAILSMGFQSWGALQRMAQRKAAAAA